MQSWKPKRGSWPTPRWRVDYGAHRDLELRAPGFIPDVKRVLTSWVTGRWCWDGLESPAGMEFEFNRLNDTVVHQPKPLWSFLWILSHAFELPRFRGPRERRALKQ